MGFVEEKADSGTMHITREQLYHLVQLVKPSDYDLLFQLLMKFIPEVDPLPDEVEAMKIAKEQIANGEVYDGSAIDWE